VTTQPLKSFKDHIQTIAAAHGRNTDDIRLLAVSKGQSAQSIRNLYAQGQRAFGENYVEELLKKAAELSDLPDLLWVFIGQLQSNKIQRLLAVVSEIQTVTSLKHLRYIDRYAAELGKAQFPVWLEVNVGGESTKSGIPLDEVADLAQAAKTFSHLCLKGIMAIPPATFSDQTHQQPPELYQQLRRLANLVGEGQLSLGMSQDLSLAIAAGSNCLRIGRALMGERA